MLSSIMILSEGVTDEKCEIMRGIEREREIERERDRERARESSSLPLPLYLLLSLSLSLFLSCMRHHTKINKLHEQVVLTFETPS